MSWPRRPGEPPRVDPYMVLAFVVTAVVVGLVIAGVLPIDALLGD